MQTIKEFFTYSTASKKTDWSNLLLCQECRYSGKKCYKTRKSAPDVAIGTCTVAYGKDESKDIVICPNRLLERNQIFLDCLHLLTNHEPGNEIHIVSEVSIPGGSVDYVLVSTDKNRKVKDFVGIELQTLDTTGSLWTERQKFLYSKGLTQSMPEEEKGFGMNWKMTAKTILVQLHHKINTFEHLNRHFVLVVQDCLLNYIKREFAWEHINTPAKLGDSMHFHSYELNKSKSEYKLHLLERFSTDSEGISRLLGLQANANLQFDEIARILETKISDKTIIQF